MSTPFDAEWLEYDDDTRPARPASAPDILTGDEGEVVFVRGDLGASETAARAYALRQGTNLSGFDAEAVEMLPVPECFVTDAEWWVVRAGTEYAVRYWRFAL